MLLGCIADDFTGAGDVANTLARGGMRTKLFVGGIMGDGDCDAGVIALKTRSIDAGAAVAQSLAALAMLQAAGCRQILFKYCSTFDSTPAGNIGPVVEALAAALNATGVVICPAFPGTGRTVYQGHLFVADRLLSESSMADHPLTPMRDPDIRRWLARQTGTPPGHVPHAVVRAGPDAIAAALATGETLMVVDAISNNDLHAIGAAAAGAQLISGASGVALGLPDNFRRAGLLTTRAETFRGMGGLALILAGSCSVATRAQVANYAIDHPALAIDVARLVRGEPVLAEAKVFARSHAGESPLIYSSADPAAVHSVQTAAGGGDAAAAVERLMALLAVDAVRRGVERLVIAGGETSGAVVEALGVSAIGVGPEIDPGVPVLHVRERRLALALKSGNFGTPDFMAKAVVRLGNPE